MCLLKSSGQRPFITRVSAGLLMTTALLVGCGPTTDTATSAVHEETTLAVDVMPWGGWRLSKVGDLDLLNPKRPLVTIVFDAESNRVWGSDGCNRFMGQVIATDDGGFTITSVGATKKGCPAGTTPAGFYPMLDQVHRLEETAEGAVLLDATGQTLAVLVPNPDKK